MAIESLNEVDLVQNAAFGAALIWNFGIGYQENSSAAPPPFMLTFLVLPVCLHGNTLEHVLSTQKRSGLALFAGKVGEARENLLAIHPRALLMRQLSFESIGVGVRAGMLSIGYSEATIRSNIMQSPPAPERIRANLNAASRFGYWCGALPLISIASLLKLDF